MSEFEALVRHARQFGTEGVFECATGLSSPERLRLRIELDSIEAEARGVRFKRQARRRRTRDETTAAVIALREEGLVVGAIAEKLAVTDETVRNHLSRAVSMRADFTRNGSRDLPVAERGNGVG